jgi:streptogramin lyase
MLALYRVGRQADALERYREGRRSLVEEIGIEPSRELQELQAAILRQDPALDLPTPTSPPSKTAATAPRPAKPRRSRPVIAAICVLAVAAGVFGAVVAEGPARHLTLGREALGVIDPVSGAVVASRAIGGAPGPIAVGRRIAWLGDGDQKRVVAVLPTSLRPVAVARIGAFPFQLATDGSSVWVGDSFDGMLTRVGSSGTVTAAFKPEPNSTGRLALAYGAGSLWIGSQDASLTELDPHSDKPIAVTHGIGKPNAVAVTAGAVWVAEATSDRLLRVALTSHRVIEPVPIGGTATDLAVGDGAVWAVTPEQGRLWRVEPKTGAVTASVDIGPDFSLIAIISHEVWVASPSGTVERIDPAQNAVIRTLHFDGPIGGIAGGDGRLWISVR